MFYFDSKRQLISYSGHAALLNRLRLLVRLDVQ
jgi:hypothetical protein